MIRYRALALILGLAALTAQANPFEPMAWLVKRCWVGTLPDGKPDQHCYAWQYGDKFIHDRHVVSGSDPDYQGETLYAWDADQGRIVYWYWTSTGSYSTGHVEVEGDVLVFPERHVLDDGRVMEMRSELRQVDDNHYRTVTRRRLDEGEWEVMWEVIYQDVRLQTRNQPAIETPVGERWALAFNSQRDGNYEIYRLDLVAETIENLSSDPGTDWVYSGGATLLALSRRNLPDGSRNYRLHRIDQAGHWFPVGAHDMPDSAMDGSPDGDRLVVALGRDGDRELYVIDLAGTIQRRLTNNDCRDTDPNWSPDGRSILYRSLCGGASDLWVLDLVSGRSRKLTNDPDNDQEPGYGGEGPGRFSPDGQAIAWMSWHDGDWDVWVMAVDGSDARDLTDNGFEDSYPDWSPDGRYLAFHSDRDGNYEIYVMDANGGQPRRMTFSPGPDLAPVWQRLPAPDSIDG